MLETKAKIETVPMYYAWIYSLMIQGYKSWSINIENFNKIIRFRNVLSAIGLHCSINFFFQFNFYMGN